MKLWQYAVIITLLQVSSFPLLASPASLGKAPMPPASPAVALSGDVKLVRVRSVGGVKTEEQVEPKVVVPGDTLVFSTRYRNEGALPVTDFVVTNPIPAAVMLAPQDTERRVISVDGGKTWGFLEQFQVDDGKGGSRPATSADVTHTRWKLALIEPGATGVLSYKAIVR